MAPEPHAVERKFKRRSANPARRFQHRREQPFLDVTKERQRQMSRLRPRRPAAEPLRQGLGLTGQRLRDRFGRPNGEEETH